MSNFLKSVDDRTGLAGANRLEILLFSLGKDLETGRQELFGINVFKVREVLRVPEIVRAPDMPPGVEGMVSLRGVMIPVIHMSHFCDVKVGSAPGALIVTEYNYSMQGFLVDSVDQIVRMEWSSIKEPPGMMAHRHGGLVTAVADLKDDRIVMILDVEKILDETTGRTSDPHLFDGVEKVDMPARMFFADDSSVARTQIELTMKQMGVQYSYAKNGKKAWEKLRKIADEAELAGEKVADRLDFILTDVEMPEMDGYVLTRKIKSDKRFNGVPVIMHSSLSASANSSIGKSVGADAYVGKFKPRELADVLIPILEEKRARKEEREDTAR